MNRQFHHNGFSYKQPHKFDEAKQQVFIEAYEALKASCGKDESIVFIEAVLPTSQQKYLTAGYVLVRME